MEYSVKRIFITGAAIVLPGICSNADFESEFTRQTIWRHGNRVKIPPSTLLPSRMKRRMSTLTQMAIHVTDSARREMGTAAEDCPFIFGSANGEINAIGSIMITLLGTEHFVSPTVFHNSVHNTAPGYWSILSKSHAESTTISAGLLTFEYTLLDAISRLNSGYDLIQITVGDELITVPKWADPEHCSIDLCGSFILSTEPAQSDSAGILSVETFTNLQSAKVAFQSAVRKFKPDHIHILPVRTQPENPVHLPTGYNHPCTGIIDVAAFLLCNIFSGRLLLMRYGNDNDAAIVVMEKP